MTKLKIFLPILTILFYLALFKLPVSAFAAATLSLSPATATHAVGDTFGVDIVLDTGGDAVSGATAMLTFDAAKLQVVDDASGTGNVCLDGVNITAGTTLPQCLTNTVDNTGGTIRFDAGGLGGAGFTGHATIATIHFKAQSTGVAAVSFTFDPNSTTNTSQVAAASGPTNLLTTVNNGSYTINAAGSSSTTLPNTGALENTIMMIIGGLLFLGIGVFLVR